MVIVHVVLQKVYFVCNHSLFNTLKFDQVIVIIIKSD